MVWVIDQPYKKREMCIVILVDSSGTSLDFSLGSCKSKIITVEVCSVVTLGIQLQQTTLGG